MLFTGPLHEAMTFWSFANDGLPGEPAICFPYLLDFERSLQSWQDLSLWLVILPPLENSWVRCGVERRLGSVFACFWWFFGIFSNSSTERGIWPHASLPGRSRRLTG